MANKMKRNQSTKPKLCEVSIGSMMGMVLQIRSLTAEWLGLAFIIGTQASLIDASACGAAKYNEPSRPAT